MPTLMLLFCFLFLTGPSPSSASENNCTSFSTTLPILLRELRIGFEGVKGYFQSKDELLSVRLLDESLQNDFKSYLGCQALLDMIKFYLDDVIPQAENETEIKNSVVSLKDKLIGLQRTLRQCHKFLPCEVQSNAVQKIKNDYKRLNGNAVLKAMGEFDTFINYMEAFLIKQFKS
ncbi:interleukin-10 [Antechinus flavipes]|uniref:interleukin-10 n=1 Tax=Antechinus flavipes TaxID=38775 RepID=UPI0022369CB0|nr:interleukin-10 [Antechinus flavipes]